MGCRDCSQAAGAAWAAEAAEAAAARRGAAEAAGARRTWVVSSETLPLLMSCESFSVPLAIEAISFSPSFTSAAGTWHEPRHAGSGERAASASEEGSPHKSSDSPEHAGGRVGGGRVLLERRVAAQQGKAQQGWAQQGQAQQGKAQQGRYAWSMPSRLLQDGGRLATDDATRVGQVAARLREAGRCEVRDRLTGYG